MDNTLNESQSRNAAKVAGFASAITLVGVLAVKAKQAVSRRRKAKIQQPLTTEA